MTDAALSKLSSELEDTGLLGAAAASMLGFVALGTSEPGFLVTTTTGAVWTKTIANAGTHETDIGIGTLTLNGGELTTTAGFVFDDEGLSDFNLLLDFSGVSAATPLSLVLPTSVAYLKPATKENGQVVGYERDGSKEAVRLDLPLAGALEISIRRTPDGVLSAFALHGAAAGAVLAAQGIFQINLGDKVLVLPKVLELGLSIDTLFLDLSAEASTPVSGLFPEVYDPRWMGVGAKSFGLHVPIDEDGTEWIKSTLDGFLLGFDGRVSLNGTIAHRDVTPGVKVRRVEGELDIRNDEVVKGAFGVEVDLQGVADAVSKAATASSKPGLTGTKKDIVDSVENDVAEAKTKPNFDLDGNLRCRLQLVRIPTGPEHAIVGLDVTIEAIEVQGQPAGLIIRGLPARILLWIGLGSGAAGLVLSGLDEDKALKIVGGLGLLMLALSDLGDFILDNDPQLLPTLDRLEFRRLTYRRVIFPEHGAEPKKQVDHIELDVVVAMTIGGVLSDVIGALAGRGLATADSFGELFAKTTDEVEVKGPLELEFANMGFAFETTTADGTELTSEIDERVRRIAGIKDLQVTVRKFPTIELIEPPPQPGDDGFTFPKPILGVQLISQDLGTDSRYGVALELRGLTHPDFKLESPVVAGLVLYVYPELAIEFDVSVLVEPRLRVVVPYWMLLDGAFEINKPIPSFNGTQSRIAIDIGLINSEVPKGTELDKASLGQLNDFSKYKYRFGGEYAWGDAEIDDPARTYSFWYAEGHYEGPSPIFTIGPVGVYGLAGLVGCNIAPGLPGDARDAAAIANWIEGNANSFDNVLEWPSPPTTDGWHPARDFDDDQDLYVGGLKFNAAPIGPRTVDVEGLVMLGFNQFWVAVAGRATIKVIKFGAVVIVVYDDPSKSFTLRIRFEFTIDKAGEKILELAGPIEISTGPGGKRIMAGHYRVDRGGPLVAKLLGDIFRAQLYAIYESGPQEDFGFALPGMDERPDLAPAAFSHGLMFQYGPKRIGPSSAHIRIHAAAGYNIGVSGDPFVLVGELFLSGGLHVKVLFVKVGFTLTAFLAGRVTEESLIFRGRIVLKIGMPWPISDIKIPVPLGFEVGDMDIPRPRLTAVASAMSHATPVATEMTADPIPIVPIDAVIGLRFNKPIAGVTIGADTETTLVDISPVNPDAGGTFDAAHKDTVETELQDQTFTVEFLHFLTDVRITKRPVGGGAQVTVDSMKAAWEAPATFGGSDGVVDTGHRAIYFNTLLQPELSAHPEKLGTFIEGQLVNGVIPPCRRPPRVCMMEDGPPAISEGPGSLRVAARQTVHGAMTVRETRLPGEPSPLVVENRARLGWTGSVLRLPGSTRIDVPTASRVTARLTLRTVVSRLLGTILIPLDVHLDGPEPPIRLVMAVEFAQTACSLNLTTQLIPAGTDRIVADAKVLACVDRGEITIGVEVAAAERGVHLSRLHLTGPVIMPPGLGRDDRQEPIDLPGWMKGTSEFRDGPELLLDELCFDTVDAGPGAWEVEVQTFGGGLPSDASLDQFGGTLLLDPDHDYEIRYRVRSNGMTVTDGDDEDAENIDAVEQFVQDSELTGGLRTVRFRTSPEPTTEVGPYIGFAHPAAGLAPVYAEHTVPLVSFRENDLIKRIYAAHPGAGVLAPVVRDETGAELSTRVSRSFSISSGAAGEVQEGLIAECLSEAQGFTRLDIDIFERRLEVDTRYSLTVEDTSDDGAELPSWRSSFRTSRHATFGEHVSAANELLQEAAHVPLVGADASQVLAPIFADVAGGVMAGHDELIEVLYRRALAHETGRLADDFGVGGAVGAQMVALAPDGSSVAFGFALELDEPLVGKDGVTFGGTPLGVPAGLRDKGIGLQQVGGTTLLTVRDHSGSRLLLFNSTDATTFGPVLSPITLPITFDGAAVIRAAVAAYVDHHFAALSDVDRGSRVQSVTTELASMPEMADGLVHEAEALVLPPAGSG